MLVFISMSECWGKDKFLFNVSLMVNFYRGFLKNDWKRRNEYRFLLLIICFSCSSLRCFLWLLLSTRISSAHELTRYFTRKLHLYGLQTSNLSVLWSYFSSRMHVTVTSYSILTQSLFTNVKLNETLNVI